MTKIKGFTPTSDYLCREYGLYESAIYGKVWRYTDWGGECTASTHRIADELGINYKTVRRKLKVLEAEGFVKKIKRSGLTDIWVTTEKLDFVTTIEESQPGTESPQSKPTGDRKSSEGGQKVLGTGDTESPEDSIKDTENNIIPMLSSAFWTASKIPEPSSGGKGWKDWNDGLDALVKIKATPEEVTAAVEKLDELGYGYTDPGSTVKTIVNSRKPKAPRKKKDGARPTPKGL